MWNFAAVEKSIFSSEWKFIGFAIALSSHFMLFFELHVLRKSATLSAFFKIYNKECFLGKYLLFYS